VVNEKGNPIPEYHSITEFLKDRHLEYSERLMKKTR